MKTPTERGTMKRLRWLSESWPIPLDDLWQSFLCLMFGHLPRPDQCGMPAHDFCAWCQKSLPGMAERATPPLTGDCETDCQDECAYPGQFSECELGATPPGDTG